MKIKMKMKTIITITSGKDEEKTTDDDKIVVPKKKQQPSIWRYIWKGPPEEDEEALLNGRAYTIYIYNIYIYIYI